MLTLTDLENGLLRRAVARVGMGLLAIALPVAPASSGPTGAGFALGPFRAFPTLGVDLLHEDNFFRTNLKEKSTWINLLRPGIRLNALKGPDAYNLFYGARIGTVLSSTNDNFVDHRAGANANWQFGLRHRLGTSYEFLRWHDPRGSGEPTEVSRPNFLFKHPDIWRSNRLALNYSFGAPGAKGRIDLRASWAGRRYLNNDQEGRDNDRLLLGGTFSGRVRPNTALLIGLDWEAIDYVNQRRGSLSRDGQNWWAFGGVTWDATAKTSGTLKIGYIAKEFDDSERSSYDNLAWSAGLTWRPRTYSIVDLTTSRRAYESADALADSVAVSALDLNWNHYWKPRLRSRIGAYVATDDYNGTERTDHRYRLRGGVYYQIRNWLELGAGYRYERRTSDFGPADYSNNVFALTLDARY